MESTCHCWSSLPDDVFAKCVLYIERQRSDSDAPFEDSWTWTLRRAASVCRNWRRVVQKNLHFLAPRCYLKQLPLMVTQCPSLRVLDLKRCKPCSPSALVSDPVAEISESLLIYSELHCLSSLTQLQQLEIRHINDRALDILAGCSGLRSVHIGGYLTITAQGVQSLTRLPQLTRLEFDGDGTLESADYLFLSSLPRLEKLSLQKCSIDDDGLRFLSALTRLSVLCLSSSKGIRGRGFRHLSSLSCLQLLDVSSTDVSDASFVHLRGCKNLTSIVANFCHLLMPQGTVQSFSSLPLRHLRVMRCDALTLESVLELKQKLKNCHICFQKTGDVFQEPVLFL